MAFNLCQTYPAIEIDCPRRIFDHAHMKTHLDRALAIATTLLLTLAACGPSIDQASKRDIDQRLARLNIGSERFARPTGMEPKPLAVGQWVEYRTIDEDGKPGLMKQMITGQEGNAYWYELISQSYSGRTAMRILLSFGDRKNPDTFDIKAVRIKDNNGEITDYPPAMLGILRSTWNGVLESLVIRWEGLPQEDATAPAGTFEGCWKGRSKASWGPYSATSTVWSHTNVPISGAVKTVGEDKQFTMELIAFGDTGAQSEF